MGKFWSLKKKLKKKSFSFGKKNFDSDTDTEIWPWFWFPIPKPGFGCTLGRISQIITHPIGLFRHKVTDLSCLFSHGTFLIIWIAICGDWSYSPSCWVGNARKDYIKVMITNGGLSFSLTHTFYLIQPSTYFEHLLCIIHYYHTFLIASLSYIKNVLRWFPLLWPNWPQIPKASRSLSS